MMSAQVPHLRKRVFAFLAVFSAALCHAATVDIHPGQDIPTVVASNPAGTTFVIYPGTYRITQQIIPKTGDSFIGQTVCAPPKTSCPAIISGSIVIGSQAKYNGTSYEVTGMTQQGPVAVTEGHEHICDPAYPACIYPEDLFFDGVPYEHLYSSTLPVIGPGQWWFNYSTNTIYFHDNPSGHTVETSVTLSAFAGGANNVKIQYLTVKEFANMFPYAAIGAFAGNDPLTQVTNWTVQNCEVLLNHGSGVRIGYQTHVLNNYIHNNGQIAVNGGIGSPSTAYAQPVNAGIVIEGNIMTYNDFAHFNPDFGAGGVKVGSTSGITIRGNTIQNNEGSGIHFDDYSQNAFVDNNIITDNIDADALAFEMGVGGTSTFRNNTVLRNGKHVNDDYSTSQIGIHDSTNVNVYCNVIEIAQGTGMNGFVITAANRGNNLYPPYQYLVTTGNQFHHNTEIWDEGAVTNGASSYIQDDAANQPNFFTLNSRPDYNNYHLSSTKPALVYDNNDSQLNQRKTFAEYQASLADPHGTADYNYTSGFPTVAITSPLDQSSFSSAVTINASASDKSGINRVEFYVDWTLQKTVAGPPYSFDWANATTGTHTVTAMAYSNAGIRNCYAVTVTKN
jgi:parallel beta-helix repeat protein